jgi:23S rRNA pseudouridine2605 synthase
MRINKYIATSGVASRRKAEELIVMGAVKVNGKVVLDLSTQISETDEVLVNNRPCKATEQFVYVLMHKPRGCMTTCNDDRGRKTIMDVLKDANKGKDFEHRVFPVGRLDYDSSGLLILTNDGEFSQSLAHPKTKIQKTYVATLDTEFEPKLIEKLENGIEIEGEMTHPAKAKILKPKVVEIIITQGRNRQVRKMFAALGYDVKTLVRTHIGAMYLGAMPVGTIKILYKKPDKVYEEKPACDTVLDVPAHENKPSTEYKRNNVTHYKKDSVVGQSNNRTWERRKPVHASVGDNKHSINRWKDDFSNPRSHSKNSHHTGERKQWQKQDVTDKSIRRENSEKSYGKREYGKVDRKVHGDKPNNTNLKSFKPQR